MAAAQRRLSGDVGTAARHAAAVEARKPEVVVVLSLLEEKKATVELAAS